MGKIYSICIMLTMTCVMNSSFALASQCNVIKDTVIKNGVEWKNLSCSNTNGLSYTINVIDADTSVPGVSVKPIAVANTNTLQTLPNIASQDSSVIAGVNGGFFYNAGTDPDIGKSFRDNICPSKSYPQTGNLGDSLTQIDGQVISSACLTDENYLRSVFVINNNQNYFITQVGANQPIQIGGVFPDAIGAGPTLVKNGEIDITAEGFEWYTSLAARTAVGINGSHVYLVTVDKSYSGGMTINELADFMLYQVHATDAMNLDGGGSTTMCVTNSSTCNIINSPSDSTGARAIYNGLFIVAK